MCGRAPGSLVQLLTVSGDPASALSSQPCSSMHTYTLSRLEVNIPPIVIPVLFSTGDDMKPHFKAGDLYTQPQRIEVFCAANPTPPLQHVASTGTSPNTLCMPGSYSCCSKPLLASFPASLCTIMTMSQAMTPDQLRCLLQCVDTPAAWPSPVCSPPLPTASSHSSHQAAQPNQPWW